MQNYIYEATWTQELEDMIENDKAKPLIVEMFYKYGLRVYDKTYRGSGNYGYNEYFLTLDGLYYCSVWSESIDGKDTYAFLGKKYKKARGRDDRDRCTIRSVKLSTLMKVLEKNDAVPSDAKEATNKYSTINAVVRYMAEGIRGDKEISMYKNKDDIPTEDIVTLFSVACGTKDYKDITIELKERCKKLLDKWAEQDENVKSLRDKCEVVFKSPMYVIHRASTRGIVVGKVVYDGVIGHDGYLDRGQYQEIEPFRRVMQIEDYESDELNALYTMLITHLENNPTYQNNYRPSDKLLVMDGFIPELNMASYYSTTNSFYEGTWLLIPTQVPMD